ncbi:MAG: hypothetical protein ACEQSB_03340 [Undibacterium sp.]
MHPPFAPIPHSLEPIYRKLRITLFVLLFAGGLGFAYTFIFPTITTSFDFRNPKSSKNQIFDPRSSDGAARTNGKTVPAENLIVNTSPIGDFSTLSISLDLEKKSATPAAIDIRIRRNYRAFLFPLGEPILGFESRSLYRIDDTYYELRDKVLYPFVSAAAFHSRFPEEAALAESREWREQYAVSNEFIGFRIGSLVSFADGIFIITSEHDMRPIGSAEIFLALGLHFEDVIPGTEEDLGIYKRGRIFLLGAPHPDGTLFQDRESSAYYLIENGMRRPVLPGPYLTFLLTRIHPVLATSPNEAMEARCTALAGLLPRTLDCTTPLDSLTPSIGSDYEITLSGSETTIDIATRSLDFSTRLDTANGKLLLSKVKERLLNRFSGK